MGRGSLLLLCLAASIGALGVAWNLLTKQHKRAADDVEEEGPAAEQPPALPTRKSFRLPIASGAGPRRPSLRPGTMGSSLLPTGEPRPSRGGGGLGGGGAGGAGSCEARSSSPMGQRSSVEKAAPLLTSLSAPVPSRAAWSAHHADSAAGGVTPWAASDSDAGANSATTAAGHTAAGRAPPAGPAPSEGSGSTLTAAAAAAGRRRQPILLDLDTVNLDSLAQNDHEDSGPR